MSDSQQALVSAAQGGDERAFERLTTPHRKRLLALAYRMVGHPEDAEDVVQDSLLQAFRGIGGFRGEADFGTWLFSITTRRCLNHLRGKKRWRWDAQEHLRREYAEELHSAPDSPARDPQFAFDAREHVAFCFTCVGRTLPPDEQAALVLRDVFEYKNREAARLVGASESVLRHSLARARARMQDSFDGLCSLVSKTGVCYQCAGLRRSFPEQQRGSDVPVLREEGDPPETALKRRLAVVRAADLEGGASAAMHREMYRRIDRIEERAEEPAG